MMIHYAKTVKRKGMLAVNVRKIKALTVRMDIKRMQVCRVTLVKVDKISHAL